MWRVAEPTVDDLHAGADALEVIELELRTLDAEDVREPHRHAYHELIWIRGGHGRHLIDGEPVEFGPHTLTLIAQGQVHQFERAEGVSGLVARFDDGWLGEGLAGDAGRRVLFSSHDCTSLGPPEDEAERFDALLDLLRVEVERPRTRDSAELRRHLLSAALLWAKRWRDARFEEGGASRGDVQLHESFLETLERDFATSHDAGHYASELNVTTGTLSRTLSKLTGRTTKQLITERVILEAVRLLRFSDLSIKEIAARLGFSDQFAFSKAFKRQRGEAPLDFRNRSSATSP
jgi:AraC family transcriptional regulator, transcriptional activator of pobA